MHPNSLRCACLEHPPPTLLLTTFVSTMSASVGREQMSGLAPMEQGTTASLRASLCDWSFPATFGKAWVFEVSVQRLCLQSRGLQYFSEHQNSILIVHIICIRSLTHCAVFVALGLSCKVDTTTTMLSGQLGRLSELSLLQSPKQQVFCACTTHVALSNIRSGLPSLPQALPAFAIPCLDDLLAHSFVVWSSLTGALFIRP